jgi:hypothetical protein
MLRKIISTLLVKFCQQKKYGKTYPRTVLSGGLTFCKANTKKQHYTGEIMPIDIKNEIDLYQFLSQGNLINPSYTGAYKTLVNNDIAVANEFYGIINSGNCPILPFHISKLSLQSANGIKTNYTLCPDTDILIQKPTDYGFLLLREHRKCPGRGAVAQQQLLSLKQKYGSRAKSKKLKDPVIWAYYISYHNERPTGGDKPENVLGYVDFHITNPVCPYVVTGQMNGCHLIVSASPHAGFLRAWHYQSPRNFPFKVYAWLTDRDYAGTRQGVDVCGFNYLQFDN